jgi:hypothetical protein
MNLPAALFPDVWHWVSFLIVLAIGYRLAIPRRGSGLRMRRN